MSLLFLDTSALAKRYVMEIGSAWIIDQVQPVAGNTVIISELAIVEMCSLLFHKQQENLLAGKDLKAQLRIFLWDVQNEYVVIEVDNALLRQANNLILKYSLGTLDAIQLASLAQGSKIFETAITFVGADPNLLASATTEGFATDNPLQHP